MHLPEVSQKLVNEGAEIVGSHPDDFKAFMIRDINKWAKVVEAAGMRVD